MLPAAPAWMWGGLSVRGLSVRGVCVPRRSAACAVRLMRTGQNAAQAGQL